MVGHGSFLPVDEAFALARRALPALKRVGIAWNPAESNSEAFTRKAREACRALGLTLLEANVENTSGVAEAVQSLASRGAQALFVGGDNTMMSAVGIGDRRRRGRPASRCSRSCRARRIAARCSTSASTSTSSGA